jgi:hypothetical protein
MILEKNMLEKTDKKYERLVYYPKQYSILYAVVFMTGICCLVLILLIMSMEELKEAAWFLLMGGVGDAGCLIFAIGYARFKIFVEKDGLIAIPMFGRKKVIPYGQITEVKYGMSNKLIIIKGRKKLISVGNYAVGYQKLCELCSREVGKN